MRVCRTAHVWDDWLAELPAECCDLYFTEAYHRLHETEKDKAEAFLYRENGNVYVFPYLKRENTVAGETFLDFESAYGYGGPVSNSQDKAFLAAAEAAFVSSCRERGFIAGFIRFCPWLDNDKLMADSSRVSLDRKTVLMDLTPSEEQIWSEQIHTKHRNVIRKAEREGLTYEVDYSFANLADFIRIYSDTMRRLNASNFYLFPDTYFSSLKETLAGQAFIGLVRYRGEIISGAIFFHQGVYAHYHLAGSVEKYQSLAPNNLLIYRTALYLKQQGARAFHLGGGADRSPDNKLFKFKQRFSPNTRDFSIGKFIFDRERYDKVCRIWAQDNREKVMAIGHMLLKYRN